MTLRLNEVALFLNGAPLLKSFSLEVAAGEIVSIMGPSGSGKSALLSFIGGDLPPAITATGSVWLNGADLAAAPPERRGIARLFQDDLLFPHMTVAENLLFAVPRATQAERQSRVKDALQQADLAGFENRPPHTLSGGQRARVALLRALLSRPAAILLDEPFGKLDQTLREAMRAFTFGHIRTRNIPALLVTHDREDVPAGGRVLHILPGGDIRHV